MYCVKCGTELRDGTKLCKKCSDFFTSPGTAPEPVTAPAVNTRRAVGQTRTERKGTEDPTITGLLNSLADGSFRRTSPAPRSPLIVIFIFIGIAMVAAGIGGYWYWDRERGKPAPLPVVDRHEAEKPPEKEVFVYVKENMRETPAPHGAPVRKAITKKTAKKKGSTPPPKMATGGEQKAATVDRPVEEARKEELRPRKDEGSWLDRWLGPAPDVTPPSRDPRETGR
jgi:hypothetical protein